MIGTGPRLGLGLGHRQTQPIDALVLALALDDVRARTLLAARMDHDRSRTSSRMLAARMDHDRRRTSSRARTRTRASIG